MLDALALGVRHGLDADHLAAISELTASQRGGWPGFMLGARYALGHAAAVVVVGAGVGAARIDIPNWVIGATLVGLGVWSAIRLLVGHTHEHVHIDPTSGERTRHTHRHRHAVGIGVVHGLGGAPAAVLIGGRGGLALGAFSVGLLAMNGVVGVVAGMTTRLSSIAWLGVLGGTAYGLLLLSS